ncbi:helix-turn-helix domain-containing protein [Variovorax paradoxus]|uniref:helix-turn-helix domain-containing protein n=2 Tax=Variovorax TaxID=34072 RepID=UPI00339ABA4B
MREAGNAHGRSWVLLHWLEDAWRQAAGRSTPRAGPGSAGPGSLRNASPRSQRQRERVFLREHGVSMSRYRSIERFQHAVAGLAGGQSGAALALEAGYADQSHMCHQVRSLSGLAPTQLKRALSAGLFTATYAAMPGFEKQLVL